MKNLFKVFALLLGLGLIFSHGASATTISSYTYNIDESSFNVVQNASFLNFVIPVDKFFANGESFEATINMTSTNSGEFNARFQVAQNSLFSASSSISFGKAEITAEKLYDTTNDNYLSVVDFSTEPLTANHKYDWKVNFNSTDVIGTGKYTIHTNFDIKAVSPVPEPEEWAMMTLGLPLMGWFAKRKKSAV